MTTILQKQNIADLLKTAVKKWNTFVPQKKTGGDVWFEPLPRMGHELDEALSNVTLESEDVAISSKDTFFPQSATLFELKDGQFKESVESSPKLIFGIRPCDLKGLLFVDDFYARNIRDKYYSSRMSKRLIVVQGCLKPPRPDACFCTSTKTGPFSEAGYDLQLIESGDFYYVEIGSKNGQDFVSEHKMFFEEQKHESEKIIEQIKSDAKDAISLRIDFSKALELMAKDDFTPEETYRHIAERCIFCGACIYACPTCTCFNIFDNVKDGLGERVRIWDACVFEGYTREASGYNPRKEKWLRTARRYEHKLKYDYAETGISGCIGCGRCLARCPVSLGMSKFVKEITENNRVIGQKQGGNAHE